MDTECSRHCCHVSGQSPLLVGRQNRFVSGSACEMFPTCRLNSQIALKFSNLSFFFLAFERFSKIPFDVLNPPPSPHPRKFRNYVAEANIKCYIITCPKRDPKMSRTTQCNIKPPWQTETAKTTTHDSIRVHPMWVAQSIKNGCRAWRVMDGWRPLSRQNCQFAWSREVYIWHRNVLAHKRLFAEQ